MAELFVLDCSVSVAWFFEDEECIYSAKILEKLESARAIVPFLWNLEVINAINIAEKRCRIDRAKAAFSLDRLNALEIIPSVFSPSREELLIASRSYDLTSYDALYLMLAIHERIPLATKDKALIRACDIVGVEVLK